MKITKNIKKLLLTTSLFTLAGIFSMSAVFAKAEDEATEIIPPAEFYMEVGASVNINAKFGGISWTTQVDLNWSHNGDNEGGEYVFGAFVMPVSIYESVTDGNYAAVAKSVKVEYNSGNPVNTSLESFKYRTGLSYDNLITTGENAIVTEEQLKKAYALELTAVAYAYDENTGTYYYAKANDNARSARQVANVAYLNDVDSIIDADEEMSVEEKATVKGKVKSYFGGVEARNDAKNSAGYLDLTEIAAGTAQTIDATDLQEALADVDEVVVGAKKVPYTYVDGVFTVLGAPKTIKTYESIEKGEVVENGYSYISVFTKSGEVYSVPVVAATALIDNKEELAVFGTTTTDLTGYYLLMDNITCTTNDIFGEKADPGREAPGLNNAIFDGQGHSISGFQTAFGVFKNITGSVVRNLGIKGSLGFTDNTYTAAATNSIVSRTISNSILDNMYIELTGWNATCVGSPVSAEISNTVLNKCVVKTATLSAVRYLQGNSTYHQRAIGSISSYTKMTDFLTNTFSDTYVLSGMPLSMEIARTAGRSYRGQANVQTVAEYYTNKGALKTNGSYYYVAGLSNIVDTKAEADIQATQDTDASELGIYTETLNADGTRTRVISMTHYNSSSASSQPTEVTVTLPANVKTTKCIYATNRSTSYEGQAYRYFDYTDYRQITSGVKRYDNITAMRADNASNAESLATFDTTYWKVDGSGSAIWRTM